MPGVVYCFNKIVEKPAHAQTVDTRPFFSPSAPPCACKKGDGSRLGGRHDVTIHVRGKHHIDMAKACSSRSVASFFKPQASQAVIEAESLWSKFVAKYNISFQTSDHASELDIPPNVS